MRRAGLAGALALVMGCGSGVTQNGGGQSATSATERSSAGTDDASQEDSVRKVTLTGCVRSGADAPADSSDGGARSPTSGGGTYMLTNARNASAVASTAGPSGNGANGSGVSGSGSGATGGRAAGSGGDTYVLEGEDIQEHVGHQVQITGTLMSSEAGASRGRSAAADSRGGSSAVDNPTTGSSGADTGRDASGGAAQAANGATSMRLQVASVRTISNSCSD